MRWTVAAVGRLKESFYQQGCAEYLARLQRYRQVGLIEVPECPPKQGDAGEAAATEGAALLKAVRGSVLVALTERGEALTTTQLASRLQRHEHDGQPLAFVLGGPDGLAADLEAQAAWRLSLSALTLPYQLARLVLLEQLYRVETLRKNEPYHRADPAWAVAQRQLAPAPPSGSSGRSTSKGRA